MSAFDLKAARIEDYDCFYSIRSEETNLFWTGYEKAPDYHNFKTWFASRIEDPNRNIFMLHENDSCLGALNIDLYPDHAFIGYSIKSEAQGKGLASFMVRKVEALLPSNNGIQEIRAWINFQNIASIKVCEKNGFHQSDKTEIRKRFGKDEHYYLMVKPL